MDADQKAELDDILISNVVIHDFSAKTARKLVESPMSTLGGSLDLDSLEIIAIALEIEERFNLSRLGADWTLDTTLEQVRSDVAAALAERVSDVG